MTNMKLYRFTWSDNTSQGYVFVVHTTVEDARTYAQVRTKIPNLVFESSDPIYAGLVIQPDGK